MRLAPRYENAPEELVKKEMADNLSELENQGDIDANAYSKLYNLTMDAMEKMYDLGRENPEINEEEFLRDMLQRALSERERREEALGIIPDDEEHSDEIMEGISIKLRKLAKQIKSLKALIEEIDDDEDI